MLFLSEMRLKTYKIIWVWILDALLLLYKNIIFIIFLYIHNFFIFSYKMKIDIYNFIINEMIKILPLKSPNNKYTHQIIFDSLIFILKSAISWNSKIIINNNIVYTNSIYKHFIILTKMNFFIKTLKK